MARPTRLRVGARWFLLLVVIVALFEMWSATPGSEESTEDEALANPSGQSTSNTLDGSEVMPSRIASTVQSTLPPVQQHESGCWRKCDSYNNVMTLEFGRAGLGDISWASRMASNVAGYLCAKVLLGAPHEILDPKHNDGKIASKALRWSDFLWTTFDVPGANMPFIIEMDGAPFRGLPRNELSETVFPGALIVDTIPADAVIADFLKVEALSLNGTRFVWRLRGRIYQYSKTLLKFFSERADLQGGDRPSPMPRIDLRTKQLCEYTSNGVSWQIREMQDRVAKKVRAVLPGGDVSPIFLHIRRGDAKSECNTTLGKMAQRIACSLHGCLPDATVVVLLSDEKDHEYRRAIGDLLRPYARFVDGDKIVSEAMKEFGVPDLDNNHVAYSVANVIERISKGHMHVRRRISCHDCYTIAPCLRVEKDND